MIIVQMGENVTFTSVIKIMEVYVEELIKCCCCCCFYQIFFLLYFAREEIKGTHSVTISVDQDEKSMSI